LLFQQVERFGSSKLVQSRCSSSCASVFFRCLRRNFKSIVINFKVRIFLIPSIINAYSIDFCAVPTCFTLCVGYNESKVARIDCSCLYRLLIVQQDIYDLTFCDSASGTFNKWWNISKTK